MFATLDPHTNFFAEEDFRSFMQDSQESYTGLGIIINLRNGRIVIDRVFNDSPAEKAGLKKNDTIVRINDETTDKMSPSDVSARLAGKENTSVDIYITREEPSKPVLKYTVYRQQIYVSSVKSEVFEEAGRRIGYVKILHFQEKTFRDLDAALDDMNIDYSDFKGIILDLRGNPGGLLDQSVRVSNKFINEGAIVYVATVANQIKQEYRANPYNTIVDIPLMVLIDENSASASEIVSGALKKNNRAVLIGRKTFGKGSVQNVLNVPGNNGVKITDSKYLTADKISIQSIGIQPDIEINYFTVRDKYFFSSKISEVLTEADLRNNFAEWGNARDRPLFSLEYINMPDTVKADDTTADNDEENSVHNDYELNFAKNTLIDYKTEKYSYASFKEFVLKQAEAEKKQQQNKIIAGFQREKIQWSGRSNQNPEAKPVVTVKTALLSDGKAQQLFETGTLFYISATISNATPQTITGLLVTLTGQGLPFKQKHIAVGDLLPGARKTVPVEINIKTSALSEVFNYRLGVYSSSGALIEAKDGNFIVFSKEILPPIKYSADLNSADGKALCSPGAKTIFTLTAETLGNRTLNAMLSVVPPDAGSKEKNIIFTPMANNAGIQTMSAAKPVSYSYQMTLNQAVPDKQLKTKLYLYDPDDTRAVYKIPLEIPCTQTSYVVKNAQPEIVLGAEQKFVTNSSFYSFRFRLQDDQKWRDVYVLLNGKKIYYTRNLKNSDFEEIKLDNIALLTGNFNTFKIAVRDNHNMWNIREFAVLHKVSS
ncbi:hypothetical protein CHS0354_027411 [Potamilus streckersoni]|uniref:PDZ domain-containing protein n=1 Tax=Potamilus streckersoni TaxID=2493646 RepID=A0AAE0SQV6_9BIVA|nr:hypothetical protein CHS0354_027411 [Potamilus streckersoni]